MTNQDFWKGVGKAFLQFCTTILALITTGWLQ